jgi:hypothetical protein
MLTLAKTQQRVVELEGLMQAQRERDLALTMRCRSVHTARARPAGGSGGQAPLIDSLAQ